MSELLRMLETPQQRAEADAADARAAAVEMPATRDGDGVNGAWVASPTLIYVQMPVRRNFDAIAARPLCHGTRDALNYRTGLVEGKLILLSKTLECDGVTIIFQHWGEPA